MQLFKLLAKQAKRLPMLWLIRGLTAWQPQTRASEGYTIAIACMHKIPDVLLANLQMVANARTPHCKKIHLVFDCTQKEMPSELLQAIKAVSHSATVVVDFYSDKQTAVARKINWGWVYAWLSWCIAIGDCETEHLILHDLDALPLDPTFFEQLYERAISSKAAFQAIRTYSGNGISPSLKLGTTFELVMKPKVLRERFSPFDGFNKLRLLDGKLVDFDTFLWIQHQVGDTQVEPINESQLMHPSQLICDFTDFTSGRSDLTHRQHSLIMMPYFSYLGGNQEFLSNVTSSLRESHGTGAVLYDRRLDLSHICPEHWAWMEKQIRQAEQQLLGSTRAEVSLFLESFIRNAGDRRTVGKPGEGVPAI